MPAPLCEPLGVSAIVACSGGLLCAVGQKGADCTTPGPPRRAPLGPITWEDAGEAPGWRHPQAQELARLRDRKEGKGRVRERGGRGGKGVVPRREREREGKGRLVRWRGRRRRPPTPARPRDEGCPHLRSAQSSLSEAHTSPRAGLRFPICAMAARRPLSALSGGQKEEEGGSREPARPLRPPRRLPSRLPASGQGRGRGGPGWALSPEGADTFLGNLSRTQLQC